MVAELTAGLPASLVAIGIYSGIISILGMACCSFVSVWERRIRASEDQAESSAPSAKAGHGPSRPVDATQLRTTFLSKN